MRRGGHLEYNIHGTTGLGIFVWTKVQYSIFIKSPPRGFSDLIYKIEQRKKNEKKTNLQI